MINYLIKNVTMESKNISKNHQIIGNRRWKINQVQKNYIRDWPRSINHTKNTTKTTKQQPNKMTAQIKSRTINNSTIQPNNTKDMAISRRKPL